LPGSQARQLVVEEFWATIEKVVPDNHQPGFRVSARRFNGRYLSQELLDLFLPCAPLPEGGDRLRIGKCSVLQVFNGVVTKVV
jgi:hypothetical protein